MPAARSVVTFDLVCALPLLTMTSRPLALFSLMPALPTAGRIVPVRLNTFKVLGGAVWSMPAD
jgi:hypothetical protein